MAGWITYGTFTKQSGTGVQTFSGLTTEAAKALIIWSTRQTSHAVTDQAQMILGMTDGAQQCCKGINHPDNEAVTSSAQSERYDRFVWFTGTAAWISDGSYIPVAAEVEGQFGAFTSTGFTIDWLINDGAATIFHFMAFGGADMQCDYTPVQIDAATVVVTGLGFRPDCFISIGGSADSGTAYSLGSPFGSIQGFGFSNAGQNVCSWALGRGTGGAADCYSGQHTNRLSSIRTANISGAGELCSSIIVATSPDGYTLTRPVGDSKHVPYQHILAIRGVQLSIGSFNTPASGSAATIGLPFQPEAIMLQTVDSASAAPVTGMSMGAGVWTPTASGSVWIGGVDASNPSVYARSSATGKVLQARTPNATGSSSALTIDATVTSVSAVDAVIDFATAPASPVPVLYIAMRPIDASNTEAVFTNADLTIGLCWIIVTLRSSTQYVWSDRQLPDPSTYYLGWKEPRVIQWGRIRRALSGFDGQYETSDFTVTLSDTDRLLRQLDADKELVNATVAVYMISDAGRRALEMAKTVYRGVIRDASPQGTLEYRLTIKDTFEETFSTNSEIGQVPDRTVTTTDFANSSAVLVNSSAEGYEVDGAVSAGLTQVPVKTGWGLFAERDVVTFGAGTDRYTIAAMSSCFDPAVGGDTETYITVDPPLLGALSDGDAIIQVPTHTVQPSVGLRVPFWYGFISDQKVAGGIDSGDGQAPMLFVGDKVLSDGKSYGEFLWAGHACYSPGGIPIPMLYFWNEALDDLSAGYPLLGDLTTAAGSGERIALPGYANWTTLGFADPFVDYGGRRYTPLYLRGIFRDWALGIREAPINLGGVPFTVNAYGVEDVGDGSGDLITDGFKQYRHIVQNWIPPKGTSYQSGAWLASPTFVDDPTLSMIDEASFDTAHTQSAVYVTDGFRGDFGVGVNGEAISRRELIARLNVSFGCECGFNRATQFFVSLVNTDIDTTTLQPALTYVRDIFSGTWAIDPVTRELYTALPYRHTQDFFNRALGGWRSVTTGVLEVEDTGATADYGSKSSSPTLSFYMLRGKNRGEDIDDYQRGSDTIVAVLALKLSRSSTVPHLPKWQTGPAGFNYELGDVVPITHYEGLSSTGWTDRPIRIERTETDPTNFTEAVEGFDLDPMLI